MREPYNDEAEDTRRDEDPLAAHGGPIDPTNVTPETPEDRMRFLMTKLSKQLNAPPQASGPEARPAGLKAANPYGYGDATVSPRMSMPIPDGMMDGFSLYGSEQDRRAHRLLAARGAREYRQYYDTPTPEQLGPRYGDLHELARAIAYQMTLRPVPSVNDDLYGGTRQERNITNLYNA